MSAGGEGPGPGPETSRRGALAWLGVALLATAACAVNAVIEETTLMKVLSIAGAAVCLLIAAFMAWDLVSRRGPGN